MKSLKSVILFSALIAIVSGCKKEQVSLSTPPEFVSVEIGTDNSKAAYSGQDFHIEAALKAGSSLSNLKLQITPVLSGRGWSFSKVFTNNITGLNNASFHEHLLVPEDALAGDYDLLLILIDENGGRSEYADKIKVIKNPMLPSAQSMSVILDPNAHLLLSGKIKAPNKIDFIKVEVQSTSWTQVYNFSGIGISDQTEIDFKEEIDMRQAPKGHYHINITILDKQNNRLPLSYHLDK